jgi:hypothetical protein
MSDQINQFTKTLKEFDIEMDEIIFKTGHVNTLDNLLAYRYLMEAIGRSSTIKQLTLRYLTTPEQWDLIIKALAQNTSITKIDFNANSLAHIAKALKAHEVLTECKVTLPVQLPATDIEDFASALTSSKSLTSFELHGTGIRTAVPSTRLVSIFKAIKEHRGLVTCKFHSLSFAPETGRTVASMIRYNEALNSLAFVHCDIDLLTESLCEVLKLNTSIAELDLASSNFTFANVTKLLQIFKENTTITVLTLDEINLGNKHVVQQLGALLKSSTTLKKLSLVNCRLDIINFKLDLAKNKSLEWLSLAKNTVSGEWFRVFLRRSNVRHLCLDDCTIDPSYGRFVFQELERNHALTSLHMKNIDLNESALSSLGSMLRENDTLQVLHVKRGTATSIPIQPVLMALATNKALVALHIEKIHEQYHPEWEMIHKLAVLKANNSLVRLTINGEVDEDVEKRLRENRERYTGVVAFLKLMAKRQDYFFALFPMEIWTNICSHIEGADIRKIFSTE